MSVIDIDKTVGIEVATDGGDTWEAFDSGEDFNDALLRTLEIWNEDTDKVTFRFLDVFGDTLAALQRSDRDPEVAVLAYRNEPTRRFFRCRYLNRWGRTVTEVQCLNHDGKPIGRPVLLD